MTGDEGKPNRAKELFRIPGDRFSGNFSEKVSQWERGPGRGGDRQGDGLGRRGGGYGAGRKRKEEKGPE